VVVKVKSNGKHVKDSPYVCKVEDVTEPKISPVVVEQKMAVSLVVHPHSTEGQPRVNPSDIFSASIVNPENGQAVEFTTQKTETAYIVNFIGAPGKYLVDAQINGQACQGCPFEHKVEDYKTKFSPSGFLGSLFGKK